MKGVNTSHKEKPQTTCWIRRTFKRNGHCLKSILLQEEKTSEAGTKQKPMNLMWKICQTVSP